MKKTIMRVMAWVVMISYVVVLILFCLMDMKETTDETVVKSKFAMRSRSYDAEPDGEPDL